MIALKNSCLQATSTLSLRQIPIGVVFLMEVRLMKNQKPSKNTEPNETEASEARKLTLHRETLRELSAAQLGPMAGGWSGVPGCHNTSGMCVGRHG